MRKLNTLDGGNVIKIRSGGEVERNGGFFFPYFDFKLKFMHIYIWKKHFRYLMESSILLMFVGRILFYNTFH